LNLLLGQEGTGKSALISTSAETLKYQGKECLLAGCATTGIAASNIRGKTFYSRGGIPIATAKKVDVAKKTIQKRL